MDKKKLSKRIVQFENKLNEAVSRKYGQAYFDEIKRRFKDAPLKTREFFTKTVTQHTNIEEFRNIYLKQKTYPLLRLETLIDCLFDIKFQLYLMLEVAAGMGNREFWDRLNKQGYKFSDIDKYPELALIELSLFQDEVIKCRILWERIMNFVYFLETGKDLWNVAREKRKSKKDVFFSSGFITHGKWRFLQQFKKVVWHIDGQYRNDEIHNKSKLCAIFERGEVGKGFGHGVDMTITSWFYLNVFWPNLLRIVQGQDTQEWGTASEMDKIPEVDVS